MLEVRVRLGLCSRILIRLGVNKKLADLQSPTKLIDWYGHTGNFVLHSTKSNRSDIARQLTAVIGTSFAVLTYYEAADFASVAAKAVPPAPLAGKRWTSGIVLAVSGPPCQSVPKQTSYAIFFVISERAVGAWKEDQLTEGGILDREKRGGGWGALSGDVSRQVGGVWTARSLRTVNGTLEKARHHPKVANSLSLTTAPGVPTTEDEACDHQGGLVPIICSM